MVMSVAENLGPLVTDSPSVQAERTHGAQVAPLEYLASRDTETHRVCGTCNELLPNVSFYKDGKDNHGNVRFRRDCKHCYKVTRMHEYDMKQVKAKKAVGRPPKVETRRRTLR